MNLLSVLKPALALLLCVCFASCQFFRPYSIKRVKADFPLHAIIVPDGYDYNDTKIRTAILQYISLGASRQQIESFLEQHFVDTVYSVASTSPKRALYQTSGPHVFVRAVDVGNSAGGETVEIYLILDSNEHLQNIVVKSHRAYL